MTQKRDWARETSDRVRWIRDLLSDSHTNGVTLGISGGKDSAVVAALCKEATPNVLGVIMPCCSIANDREDALILAEKLGLELITADLTRTFEVLTNELTARCQLELTDMALANVKPRLRMTTLYAIAQSNNYLVAGTGNALEIFVGYFTKWGDGACDFNPISDLTVEEVLDLGKYLGVPEKILSKRPSAGLWPGQLDEEEMGIKYSVITDYIADKEVPVEDREKISKAHEASTHKRRMPKTFRLL